MKKLMITAVALCVAVVSNAASYNWSTRSTGTSGQLFDGTSSATAYTTYGAFTVYLLDSNALVDSEQPEGAKTTQSWAFNGLKNGKFDTTKAIGSTSISTASRISSKSVEYGTDGENSTLYWVAIMDDDPNTFYISSELTNPTFHIIGKLENSSPRMCA